MSSNRAQTEVLPEGGASSPLSPSRVQECRSFGEEVFAEIRIAFDNEVSARLAELVAAYEREDLDGVAKAAHSVKGMSGNVGAWRLEALAAEIGSKARGGSSVGVGALLPALQQANSEAQEALAAAVGAGH